MFVITKKDKIYIVEWIMIDNKDITTYLKAQG